MKTLSALNTSFQRLITLGVQESIPEFQKRQIRILNMACLGGVIVCLPLALYNFFINSLQLNTLLNISLFLIFSSILYFHTHYQYQYAKFIAYYPVVFIISFIAYYDGLKNPQANTESALIIYVIVGVVLYDNILKYVCIFFTVAGFFIAKAIKIYTWHFPFDMTLFVNLLIPMASFITMYGLTNYYKRDFIALLEINNQLNLKKDIINAQAEKLQETNALKDKLFSIIAHDLRSPLAQLGGTLNLANTFTDADWNEILPHIAKNTNDVSVLVENLLYWSRNQLQGKTFFPQRFDLKESSEIIFSLFQMQAEQKNIFLINEIKLPLGVYGDKNMIELVLRNLVHNAIKFCTTGGNVKIFSERTATHIRIYVTDTGTGIAADGLINLFDKGLVSTRGTANEKGTGLGLMICKEFVEINGGEIWVESILGKGSTFCFSLPNLAEEPTTWNAKFKRTVLS